MIEIELVFLTNGTLVKILITLSVSNLTNFRPDGIKHYETRSIKARLLGLAYFTLFYERSLTYFSRI